jgi:hypothetical protein
MTEIEMKAWQRAGELLGGITRRLNPKGVSVSMSYNETFESVEIFARVTASGKTWAMNRMFTFTDLASAVNREMSVAVEEFCTEFTGSLAEHAAEFARERRG